jgi:hypothetical protein
MRVVVLHESPGADVLVREFRESAEVFNRGLDIRLRFLDVGFEVRDLPVPPEGAAPAEETRELLRRFDPGVALVLGTGLPLLECAAVAAKSRVPLALLTDGAEDRSSGALARLATILATRGEPGELPAGPDAVVHPIGPGEAPGPALVDLLVRTVKERRTR